jgi:hypothetical protein
MAAGLALGLAACAQQKQMDELTYSREVYIGCLRGHPPEECETQRAAFEANRTYADSVSRRIAAHPPVYTPPPRQPITCSTYGGVTNCY